VQEKRASQEVVRGEDCAGLLLSRPLDPARVAADRPAKQQVGVCVWTKCAWLRHVYVYA
jgi:hypothetical protein